MSGNELASDQPEVFEFSEENQKLIEGIIAKYPEGRQASAVIPLLDIAQRQHENWLPKVAIEKVAEILRYGANPSFGGGHILYNVQLKAGR